MPINYLGSRSRPGFSPNIVHIKPRGNLQVLNGIQQFVRICPQSGQDGLARLAKGKGFWRVPQRVIWGATA